MNGPMIAFIAPPDVVFRPHPRRWKKNRPGHGAIGDALVLCALFNSFSVRLAGAPEGGDTSEAFICWTLWPVPRLN